MTSRREFMLHGAIGVGVLSSNVSSVAALPAAKIPVRRSLQAMAWNDPIVSAYRDAVGILKKRPASQPISWQGLSSIHGTDPDTFHYCPHGDWYFLPWHRAFVTMYERIVRTLTSMPDFAMPFWDWTANPALPSAFVDKTTPDGKPNWLCVTEPGWERTWPANKPMPAEIVGPKVLEAILKAPNYESFGTGRNPMQTNTDPSWVPAGGGLQGKLEATPHNLVHNNIGGWMPSASSPRDPVFFMHHTNIDRIWALWNLNFANSTDPLWTGMVFGNNFLNTDGSFWSPKVSDLFVPEKLGYSYGLRQPQRPQLPRLLALDMKIRSVFAMPMNAPMNMGKVATVAVSNPGTASAGKPLSVRIDVPATTLKGLRSRSPVPSGTALLNFGEALSDLATGPRALAFLRDVTITDPKATMFRIFVDSPDVSAATPISDPRYVGTFGVLEHKHMAGQHAMPSFAVDLTDALAGSAQGDHLTLQVIAVANDGEATAAGTATPQRVEVAFIAD